LVNSLPVEAHFHEKLSTVKIGNNEIIILGNEVEKSTELHDASIRWDEDILGSLFVPTPLNHARSLASAKKIIDNFVVTSTLFPFKLVLI
jgi:hypothetical protein